MGPGLCGIELIFACSQPDTGAFLPSVIFLLSVYRTSASMIPLVSFSFFSVYNNSSRSSKGAEERAVLPEFGDRGVGIDVICWYEGEGRKHSFRG